MPKHQKTPEEESSTFSWIEKIPLGVAILSKIEKNVLFYNQLFTDMITEEIGETDFTNISSRTDLFAERYPKSFSIEFDFMDGKSLLETAAICPISFQGKDAFLATFKYIFNTTASFEDTFDPKTGIYTKQAGSYFLHQHLDETTQIGNIFSAAYLSLTNTDGESLEENKLQEAIDLVHKTIRGSDIFAHLDINNFIIIFPKCVQDVAESILITLLNKFSLVGAENPDDAVDIVFSHNVREINRQNIIKNPKEIIEVLKERITAEHISF